MSELMPARLRVTRRDASSWPSRSYVSPGGPSCVHCGLQPGPDPPSRMLEQEQLPPELQTGLPCDGPIVDFVCSDREACERRQRILARRSA